VSESFFLPAPFGGLRGIFRAVTPLKRPMAKETCSVLLPPFVLPGANGDGAAVAGLVAGVLPLSPLAPG
jgi:hypothetical protein